MTMRGYGFTIHLKTGLSRQWYINRQGVKCWDDNEQPVDEVLTNEINKKGESDELNSETK